LPQATGGLAGQGDEPLVGFFGLEFSSEHIGCGMTDVIDDRNSVFLLVPPQPDAFLQRRVAIPKFWRRFEFKSRSPKAGPYAANFDSLATDSDTAT
jgi:hypothetical protein